MPAIQRASASVSGPKSGSASTRRVYGLTSCGSMSTVSVDSTTQPTAARLPSVGLDPGADRRVDAFGVAVAPLPVDRHVEGDRDVC